MKCPKCNAEFEKVTFENIEVDRCLGCQGLWFDMLEKEDLIKIKGSEAIDIGSDQVGGKYKGNQNIKCPECAVTMVPMVDKDQVDIKYESCQSCYGTFYDAGEFRDLKESSVLKRFKQMLKTIRTNL